jgi:Ca2+-transporting ATPase
VQADVSLAMAGTGSEVAKEAAHILLLDDAFEKIPQGIEYGRHIFYTFKRVILYFFTTNFAEVLVMLFSLAGGYPVPLLACQILWLNLVTDGFLDTALSLEPVEKNLMNSAWLKDQTKLMTRSLAMRVLYSGFLAAGVSCLVFAWYLPVSLTLARTMTMVTLTCCQWVTALNCRSLDRSLFSLAPFSNRWLALALVGIFVTQIAIVTVPFLRVIFKTVPLSLYDWLIVGCSGLLLFTVEEIRKQIKRSSKKAY